MSQPAVFFEVFPPKSVDASFRSFGYGAGLARLAPRFLFRHLRAGRNLPRGLTHDIRPCFCAATFRGLPVPAAHLKRAWVPASRGPLEVSRPKKIKSFLPRSA